MSWSPMANPESGPDYSVFITKLFFSSFTYPVRCFRLCGPVIRVPGYRSRGPGSIPGATRFSDK
jgi:hypothetical protein